MSDEVVTKVIEVTFECRPDFDAEGFTNAAITGQLAQATKWARGIECVECDELTPEERDRRTETNLSDSMQTLTEALNRYRIEGRANARD